MSNALDELKKLLNQKTVSISKLAPLVLEVEKMYVQTSEKVSKQKKSLNELGEKNQKLFLKNKELKQEKAQLAIRLSSIMMKDDERKDLRKRLGLKTEVRYGKS